MVSDCSDSRSTLVPRGPGTSGIISRRKARRRMQSLDSRNRKNVLRAVNTDYPCYVRASHARLRPDPQRLARDLLVSIRRYPMAIFVAFHLHSTAKQHKGSRMGDVISSLFFFATCWKSKLFTAAAGRGRSSAKREKITQRKSSVPFGG